MLSLTTTTAQLTDFFERCLTSGVQSRLTTYEPGGIILTTFDANALWAYDIDRNRRYPLPNTAPCISNCHLSPDGEWVSYFNRVTREQHQMRLNGAETQAIYPDAAEVIWWSDNTLLVWTPNRDAYVIQEFSTDQIETTAIASDGIYSLQPNGDYGLSISQDGEDFYRVLRQLETDDDLLLGADAPYFNAAAWSPDGEWLAFVGEGDYDETNRVSGAELYGIRPGIDENPTRWTNLHSIYGAVRVNDMRRDNLTWSPDGSKIAFWVIELLGSNPTGINRQAILHIYDVNADQLIAYCGFSTPAHTPFSPRIVWSPESTNLAFSVPLPDHTGGNVLVALNTRNGIFTELTDGLFNGSAPSELIGWGRLPDQ
ncbi:MAG: hypothetical protein RLP44_30290 [Aggregatilineales bacterium]